MPPVYIIAEAGVNHNGDISMAKDLIRAAATAGADAIKFQHFNPDLLVCPATPTGSYQRDPKSPQQDQRGMLKSLALSDKQQQELCTSAAERGIDYLCTPFDLPSLEFLIGLNLPYLKFSSGDLSTTSLLTRAATTGTPLILSTGMARESEIAEALSHLSGVEVHLLHCTSAYPTPIEQVNLLCIDFLRERFGLPIGFSDHSLGTTAAIGAVARGAHIIEKHLSLDTTLPGPDQKASADPRTFSQMVTSIREMEQMRGDGKKRVQPAEQENRTLGRRSLVLRGAVKEGQILTTEDLLPKRPAGGISPSELERVVGKKAAQAIPADTPLLWEWLEP